MTPQIDARLVRAVLGRSGPVVVGEGGVDAWIARAHEERSVPLLHLATAADLGLPGSPDRVNCERVSAMHLDVAMLSVRLESDLLDLVKNLDAHGVRTYALLKGVAVAHLDYPDPSWRQFGDIDLLVPPDDIERALAGLATIGWTQRFPEPPQQRPFVQAFSVGHDDSLLELDLHQRLRSRAPGRLVPTEALLQRRIPFQLGDQQVWALDDVDRTLHACIHLSGSRGGLQRLSSVADVVLLSYLHEEHAADVVARADEFRMRRFVEVAIELAWGRAQLPVPDGWRQALLAPGRRQHRLTERAYFGSRRRPITEEFAHLQLIPSMRERARYLSGYVLVGRDYRVERGQSGTRRVRYLWQRIRGH